MLEIKTIIVEDDHIIRDSLKEMIEEAEGFECAGAYDCCETAIEQTDWNTPHVVLMDIELPGMSGIDGTRRIKEKSAAADIIMLTVHDQAETIFKALRAGACGYLDKSATVEKILQSIREVHQGGAPMTYKIARLVVGSFKAGQNDMLTRREVEVLDLLCQGSTYKEISRSLFISVGTVRHHIKNIYHKLHVHSKSEAVAKALRERLIDL